ncbi:hypothetical protein ACE3G8_16905 [Vreelandella venusta]
MVNTSWMKFWKLDAARLPSAPYCRRRRGVSITLISRGEAQLFAESALSLRYGDDWQQGIPIKSTDINEEIRSEDANSSQWSSFHRTK